MWAAAKGALSASALAQAVETAMMMGGDARAPAHDDAADEEDAAIDAVRELEMTLVKVTSNSLLAPEEQKLLRLVAAASDPALQPHLEAALAHRLQGCGSSLMLAATAKALVLLHRWLLAGHAAWLEACLAELPHLLSSVEAHEEAEAEYVRGCVDYLAHLGDWPPASRLRQPAACGAALAQLPTPRLVEALPPLLELARKALACAAVEPPS